MTLKNCKCGDASSSEKVVYEGCAYDWKIMCIGCGIQIYAPTEEKCAQLWNDAQEAPELRERLKEINQIVKQLKDDIKFGGA